jgi:predicted kinase
LSNPCLILLAGNPGAGKSSIASPLACALGAAHIENDALAPLVDAGLNLMGSAGANYDGDAYKKLRPAAYLAARNLVEMQLRNGISVVWAHPMQAEFQTDVTFLPSLKSMTDALSASIRPFWVHTDEDTARRRLASRNQPKDHQKLKDWSAYVQTVRFGPIGDARLTELAQCGVLATNIANPDGQPSVAVEQIVSMVRAK